MNQHHNHRFRDTGLPLDERVHDLISRLTLEEKIGLMPTKQDGIPRLGVADYSVGGEAAHGLVAIGISTTFPQTTGLACSWDADLLHEVGSAIGDEARVYYERMGRSRGLTLWAPTVDMVRDPRWGRTEEAYGEDPHLTSVLSTAFVEGIQGDHPFYIKAAAALKHFYANNNEHNRGTSSSSIDPRNKREYYLKAFEGPVVQGRVHSIMTAYNEVNGTPMIVHPDVLDIVKNEWKLDGFVVCDGDDLSQTVTAHKYCETYAEAVAKAIRAGIDCITDDPNLIKSAIREAIELSLLTESDLDHALSNMLSIRFRLGQFDPDETNPYSSFSDATLYSARHRELALAAARKSIALLKNDGILPLRKTGTIAVIGPLADVVYRDWYTGTPSYHVTPLQGIVEKLGHVAVEHSSGKDWVQLRAADIDRFLIPRAWNDSTLVAGCSDPCSSATFEESDWGWNRHTFQSIANGCHITADGGAVTVSARDVWGWFVRELFTADAQNDGTMVLSTWNGAALSVDTSEEGRNAVVAGRSPEETARFEKVTVRDGIAEAVKAARACDVAVVFVGNHPLINGRETEDRPDINLPASQERLIREVHAANPRTVVVIVGSYPFAVTWAEEHAPAIVYTSHGGQELGHAVADVLFGDYNPAGRLNLTWYASVSDLPDMMNYDIIRGHRTYQYFRGKPLYPFGHGLSYTQFTYSSLSCRKSGSDHNVAYLVDLSVKNTGSTDGEEVVQMYVCSSIARSLRPNRQLKGFTRVLLQPGEEKVVHFTLHTEDLGIWDVRRGKYIVEEGRYTIMVGSSSSDIHAQQEVMVEGERILPLRSGCLVRAEDYDNCHSVFLTEGDGGTAVGSRNGGWISFDNVELDHAVTSFEACVRSDAAAEIELIYQAVNGLELSSICRVAPAPLEEGWKVIQHSFQVNAGAGRLVLRFSGSALVSWLKLVPAL